MVYLSIGSNLGDKVRNLFHAVELIEQTFDTKCCCSRIFHSKPWGYDSRNDFCNLCVAFETRLEPLEVLHRLQGIEKQISAIPHRDDKGGYKDREIDIDIIAIDDLVVESPELTLPHPRMHLRDFVLIPMAEIAPEWIHPILKQTTAELARRQGARDK